jgi:hypothetical protein
MYHHLPLQDPPKFTQIWIFGFENKPSGNPAEQLSSPCCPRQTWVLSWPEISLAVGFRSLQKKMKKNVLAEKNWIESQGDQMSL